MPSFLLLEIFSLCRKLLQLDVRMFNDVLFTMSMYLFIFHGYQFTLNLSSQLSHLHLWFWKKKYLWISEWPKCIISNGKMFLFYYFSGFHNHPSTGSQMVLSWGQSSDANLRVFDENVEDMNINKSDHEKVDMPPEEVLGNKSWIADLEPCIRYSINDDWTIDADQRTWWRWRCGERHRGGHHRMEVNSRACVTGLTRCWS